MLLVIGIAVVFLFVCAIIWARREESKRWNGGVCKDSGKPWVRFDNDSQGGRMYEDGAGNHCSISYPRIDGEYSENIREHLANLKEKQDTKER